MSGHTTLHVVMVSLYANIVEGRHALVSSRSELLRTYFSVTIFVEAFKDSIDNMVCLLLMFYFILYKQW